MSDKITPKPPEHNPLDVGDNIGYPDLRRALGDLKPPEEFTAVPLNTKKYPYGVPPPPAAPTTAAKGDGEPVRKTNLPSDKVQSSQATPPKQLTDAEMKEKKLKDSAETVIVQRKNLLISYEKLKMEEIEKTVGISQKEWQEAGFIGMALYRDELEKARAFLLENPDVTNPDVTNPNVTTQKNLFKQVSEKIKQVESEMKTGSSLFGVTLSEIEDNSEVNIGKLLAIATEYETYHSSDDEFKSLKAKLEGLMEKSKEIPLEEVTAAQKSSADLFKAAKTKKPPRNFTVSFGHANKKPNTTS